MLPTIDIFGLFSVTTYKLTAIVGTIVLVYVTYWDSRRYKFPLYNFLEGAAYLIIAGFFGAKIFNIIFFNWSAFLQNPVHIFISNSGTMYYGSEIGSVLAYLVYMRIKKLPALPMFDSIALGGSIAHAIGRLGCYSAGCCYGTETNSVFGVHFPNIAGIVHPTQIYETILLLAIFTVLLIVRNKKFFPGFMLSIYCISYGFGRFLIEFLREDGYSLGFLRLSPSQYIGLASFIIGILVFLYQRKRPIKLLVSRF